MKRILILILSLVFLTGCGIFQDEDPEDCSDGFHMENGVCVEDLHGEGSFQSSDDIVNLFLDFSAKQSILTRALGWNMMVEDTAMDAEGADAPTNDEQGSDDYSETNNQVDGVDEMDNILTDGKYIYIQNYDKIQIVLAYTVESGIEVLDLVKEITFEELSDNNNWFYFNGMYVDDERLLVVGNSYHYTCDEYYEDKEPSTDETGDVAEDDYYECRYYEYHTTTHVYEYDKDTFELEDHFELSGYFVGSRKIGDALYFVTNEYIPFYLAEYDDYDFSIDNYLPSYHVNGTEVTLPYEDILYVEGTQPNNFTTFYGINLATNEVSTEVILGEGGYNLYVSTENIYLTGTKWNWNDALLLEMEEAADNDEEYVPEEDPYEITTSIIRIAIDDAIVSFGASGDVPGVALDQFAMDEKDGYVRIVTTGFNWWWWGTEQDDINNRLMVLDLDLEIISTLEHLGKPGESVQSTRFVGDYAYVVTFLRTDPFYVIDLSDPTNPTKLSELEIPGFSDYLQPINEDFILGIGYGDNEGGTQGLKISLYDVSDKTNAVVASELIYPYSEGSYMWTSTVYNHKDLLVSLDKGIIALPYTENTYDSDDNDYRWSYTTGVLVLNLDLEDGTISERARVEHSEANSWDTYVYKSKFISDYLYTISSKFVMVSTLADPATILNQVQIGESREQDIPGEVEPEEPVDPDVTCTDGTVLVDGECVPDDTGTDGLFAEFVHLYSWDEALMMGEHEYIIYVYGNDCDFCQDIEEQIYEYAIDFGEVYFLNLSLVDNSDGALVDAVPALLVISSNEVLEEHVGATDILNYINGQ